jgi:N-acetylmuramoyl-L-alanine amidase
MLNPAVDVVARTAWGEARGCGMSGMQAVINVIQNRAKHPRWWGGDMISVCTEPYQFSCRNQDDPNAVRLMTVTRSDPWFTIALSLAQRAADGKLPDITNGADSYYARSLPTPPGWAARAQTVYSDRCHIFCCVELPGPSGAAHAACISADSLNAAELSRVRGQPTC